MKHIVLPTDFNILSLQPIHDVLEHYRDEEVRLTLLHLLDLPTGIGDLLFRTRRPDLRFAPPAAFMEACEVLAHRYNDRIVSIRPMLRYGSTAAFLDNLLKAIAADAIAVQEDYKEQAAYKESVKLMPLIYRCNCPILETPLARTSTAVTATVGDLLLSTC